jgi:hypothetical protein
MAKSSSSRSEIVIFNTEVRALPMDCNWRFCCNFVADDLWSSATKLQQNLQLQSRWSITTVSDQILCMIRSFFLAWSKPNNNERRCRSALQMSWDFQWFMEGKHTLHSGVSLHARSLHVCYSISSRGLRSLSFGSLVLISMSLLYTNKSWFYANFRNQLFLRTFQMGDWTPLTGSLLSRSFWIMENLRCKSLWKIIKKKETKF